MEVSMKFTKISMLAFALLILTAGIVHAKGVATTMGYLSLVGNDGPFDALRSPALLTGNNDNKGIGLALTYRIWDTYDTKITLGDPSLSMKFDEPDTTVFEGTAAFLMKVSEMMSFGFAFEHEYDKTERKNTMKISSMPGYLRTENSEEKSNDSRLNAGLGLALSKELSLGVKLNMSIKTEKEDKLATDTAPSTEAESSKITTMTGSIDLGVLYNMGDTQLGFGINSGNYSRIKKDNSELKSAQQVSGSISYYTVYTAGPSLSGGIYQRLMPLIAVAAEAGLTLPRSYTSKSLEKSGTVMNQINSDMENKMTYQVHLGVEIDVTRELILSFGGMYQTMETEETEKSASGNKVTTTEGYIALLTLGADYKITSSQKINLFGSMMKYSIEMKEVKPGDSMKVEHDVTGFNIGLSFVQKF